MNPLKPKQIAHENHKQILRKSPCQAGAWRSQKERRAGAWRSQKERRAGAWRSQKERRAGAWRSQKERQAPAWPLDGIFFIGYHLKRALPLHA